ncbi:HAD family hydrolase [Ktedonospora formicarum]|uniref:HAD family hydrolase n=1 Tax=Ktedonospora formicarum TaxID=2778364 RepID=A0A8J3MQQ7_9CHLR|nr:HAD hydrolase-like protein [Ktedonospora formicarum]GHO42868.1 hypothetical protein KSX_10310 [Ktedonospora formicarum]
MKKLIIFDLDGVITSEEMYWTTAGLVLHELLYSPRYWNVDGRKEYVLPRSVEECRALSESVFPEPLIQGLKARAVNSNWDTCYAGFCLYLIDVLAQLPNRDGLFPLRPEDPTWIAAFRARVAQVKPVVSPERLRPLTDPLLDGYGGFDLLARFEVLASDVLGERVEDTLEHYSPSWKLCRDLFQEWYLGDVLFVQEYGYPPAEPGKLGCVHFEQPLLPVADLRASLENLKAQGYTLGICTGRGRFEALTPLQDYGLLELFAEEHIVTHTEVAQTEHLLREQGKKMTLAKPHPFPFLRAAFPEYRPGEPLPPRGSFIVVGDTTSDVRGARAGEALCIAVRTGARTEEARILLERSGPDFLVDNVTYVPTQVLELDDLATIQRLQFSERAKAETLLQRWFALHMDLHVESVRLTPKAVSLNSFNGFYQIGEEEYFFKTHVEEQGVLAEYYNATLLHEVGYNVVLPVRSLRKSGQQMVIYPVIRWPVMFDLMCQMEMGQPAETTIDQLVAAERLECERLLRIYRDTLASASAEEYAAAPIHQLFWHRLTGGRLTSFYKDKSLPLPTSPERQIPFEQICAYRWRINGVEQHRTLGELITRATEVLRPERESMTVVGHGDAHFGNVFLEEGHEYLYFDPAFAGRHSPLLDVIKPLFHNVFATWMYFSFEVEPNCHLSVRVNESEHCIEVVYDFTLPSVREAILRTKREYLLTPLLEWLRSVGALPDDWREIMHSALLCCPLLTINLFDSQRMPSLIGWLGLTYAVYLGQEENSVIPNLQAVEVE